MSIFKSEIPILEYDTEQKSVVMPGCNWDYEEKIIWAAVFYSRFSGKCGCL